MIKLTKSSTVDGLATLEATSKTLDILIGRGRKYVPTARAGWIGVAKHPIASLTGSLDWVWDKFEATGIPDEWRKVFRIVTPTAVKVVDMAETVLSGPTTQPSDSLGEVDQWIKDLNARWDARLLRLKAFVEKQNKV